MVDTAIAAVLHELVDTVVFGIDKAAVEVANDIVADTVEFESGNDSSNCACAKGSAAASDPLVGWLGGGFVFPGGDFGGSELGSMGFSWPGRRFSGMRESTC